MTTTTRHVAAPVIRPRPRATLLRLASIPIVLVHRLGGHLGRLAAAGQLGPLAETEVGRWTGARV